VTDEVQKDPIQIRIRDVKKRYGDHEVLRGVSFDVHRGITNVIIGASGAGKSVLTRQIIRLERPDEGAIEVDGEDIVPMNEVQLTKVRRKFGMVFQMSALFDSMTVYDNVAFPLREHTKMKRGEVRERVMARLSDLEVEHAAKKMPSELSGGMQKRVAVARALVLEPEVLIYDEPTTGLDPITSRTVDELMIRTRDQFGVTGIVITHDMASVFKIADRINYLYKGRITASGTPEEFLASQDPATRDFLEASGVGTSAVFEERMSLS
jgi:phospholipid/cholesterol/gamma-HCH transport system ATP-binding protein